MGCQSPVFPSCGVGKEGPGTCAGAAGAGSRQPPQGGEARVCASISSSCAVFKDRGSLKGRDALVFQAPAEDLAPAGTHRYFRRAKIRTDVPFSRDYSSVDAPSSDMVNFLLELSSSAAISRCVATPPPFPQSRLFVGVQETLLKLCSKSQD